jgi:hypothetical protein
VDAASLERLVRAVYSNENSINFKNVLQRYSGTTLSRLTDFFSPNGEAELGSETQIVARMLYAGWDEAVVSDAMNFLPGNPRMFNQVLSLRHYIEFQNLPVDEIKEGSRTYEQVMALMSLVEPAQVALGIHDREMPVGSPLVGISLRNGSHLFVFRDDRVIQAILDNPDKRDLIRSVIEDHGTVHYETIRDALGNGSALGAGTL